MKTFYKATIKKDRRYIEIYFDDVMAIKLPFDYKNKVETAFYFKTKKQRADFINEYKKELK